MKTGSRNIHADMWIRATPGLFILRASPQRHEGIHLQTWNRISSISVPFMQMDQIYIYNCMLTILTPQATYPCRLLVNRLCTCFLTFIDKYNNVYQCFSLLWCLDRFGLQEYWREWTKTYQMALLGRRLWGVSWAWPRGRRGTQDLETLCQIIVILVSGLSEVVPRLSCVHERPHEGLLETSRRNVYFTLVLMGSRSITGDAVNGLISEVF